MTTIPGPITYSDAWNIASQSAAPRSGTPVQTPSYPPAETPHEGAYIETSVTPLGAREANRSTVAALLDAEGIPHFAVRGTSDHGTVIAVAEPDRERVLGAVFRGLGRFPGHLSVIAPDPVRAPKPLASQDPSAWRGVRDAAAIQVSWYRTDPGGHLLLGHEYGCAIEFWRWHGGHLVAPRANRVTWSVWGDQPNVAGPARLFSRFVSDATPAHLAPALPTRQEFLVPMAEDIDFPVDAVYTWVDGNDPAWQRRKASAKGEVYHAESASDARFISRDELRYSVRSLYMFAPWIRNIYIVTDDQVPEWMREDLPGCRIATHREIFRNPADLPTFNSHSIESQLHHIQGLSEHFLYFNDDMFIGRPVAPHAFFTPSGTARYFPSRNRIPQGPVVETDTPVDAACKNNRALLRERFGKVITQPMEHIPYALRRSAMDEAELDFPQAWARTSASRFRAMTDLSPTSSFALYYAAMTGRAQTGSMPFTYLQLAVPDLADRLQRLLDGRSQDSFCLNDAFSTPEDIEAQQELLDGFLNAYFPTPSPYER
ncbi:MULTISPECIES: stealth family protein [unclassified Streptomyces]|uniref:Stealth family protein n=1 Tax=Streptomyces sp. NBC_00119 TaxID=2975659 RepID=A0AAU1U7N3_9ACTN|nr:MULTISPECIES: stealth family protein [unclassified Streptomyces]MCX4642508.1 stealth family protein [Streptomyces sp. NBC_01446]MCX5327449.1 stealth family protein [Streptomyces sp. NBC_00120]